MVDDVIYAEACSEQRRPEKHAAVLDAKADDGQG
jgi:hypothetical protein